MNVEQEIIDLNKNYDRLGSHVRTIAKDKYLTEHGYEVCCECGERHHNHNTCPVDL